MAKSFTIAGTRFFFMFTLFLVTNNIYSQCTLPACENLYIGPIGVPTDDNDLIILRNALRADIGATLDALSPCTFVERSGVVDTQIRREANEFTPETYQWISEYRDRFMRAIQWMLIGDIRRITRFNYVLEIKIVKISTRTTQYRFTFPFTYDENYTYEGFLEGFQVALLKETGQLLKVTGYTNYDKVDPRQIRVFPSPWNDKVDFDAHRSEFSFHVSKCELANEKLRINIRSASFEGKLDTLLRVTDQPTKEADVGLIKLTTNRGLNFHLKWPGSSLKHDDFDITDLKYRSSGTLQNQPDQLSYLKNEDGFTLSFPANIPANTTAELLIKSRNYRGYTSSLELGIDQSTIMIDPGQRRRFFLRKLLPGIHQFSSGKTIEGSALILAECFSIWQHFELLDQARSKERQAIATNNQLTEDRLERQAANNRWWSGFFLGASIIVYLTHWYHATFIAPFFPEKVTNRYQIAPSYYGGSVGLSLSIKIPSQ